MTRKSDRVKSVLAVWNQALEDGVADQREPDLNHRELVVSKEKVDNLINQIVDWFQTQLARDAEYWNKQGMYESPDYDKLEGGARLAFYQDLVEVVKDITDEDLLYSES